MQGKHRSYAIKYTQTSKRKTACSFSWTTDNARVAKPTN